MRSNSATRILSEEQILVDCVDGTDLVQETKDFVGSLHSVSPTIVSVTYCCQLIDGKFQYDYTYEHHGGYVYWTINNCQILGDDHESY